MKKKLPKIKIVDDPIFFDETTRLTKGEIECMEKNSSYIRLWIIHFFIRKVGSKNVPKGLTQITFYDNFVNEIERMI